MKLYKPIYHLTLFLWLMLLSSCSKDGNPVDPKPVLNHEYTGFLRLHLTNEFPSMDKTTQVDVIVNKFGEMNFSTATLSYDADEHNGQTRIRRTGSLVLRPKGKHFLNNGEDKFGVDENTAINETMTIWYGDGVEWTLFTTQNIQGTWNGGLAFDLADALFNGSYVSVNTSYGSATWSLHLVVKPQ